jgi:hypothetical protein
LDSKRRRAIAHSHANGNCDTDGDGFDHAEPDSKSDSSRTAASDTRASPDTLNSVAASRTVILAGGEQGYRRGAKPRLHRSIESLGFPHISLVTDLLPFYCIVDKFCRRCLKIPLAFSTGACAIFRLLNRRASAAIRQRNPECWRVKEQQYENI